MIWIVAYLSSVVGAFLTILAMTIIRNEQRHSVGRIGWLGLVLLSPPIGLLMFLWLGGRKISAEHEQRNLVDMPLPSNAIAEPLDSLERLMLTRNLSPPTCGNDVCLLDSPSDVGDSFLELIDSATKTIYVMTFVLDKSEGSDAIIAALCRKARSGIQVRLLVDGIGSLLVPEEQLQDVRDAGGLANRFKPVSKLSRLAYLNFRNHRKLTVVDGERAILGGANLIDDELNDDSDGRPWTDMSVRIEGPAVAQLQAVFRSDWKFATGEDLPRLEIAKSDHKSNDYSRLTVMPIGPDGPEEILDDFWQFAIHRAEQRIWIATPYFVPPPLAMRSLELACRRGIDVQILVPQTSDIPLVDYARHEYFKDLFTAGCTIHRHPDRMIHAKVGIVDDWVALIGSANFDVRSFFLNYELSVLVHDKKTIAEMSEWYEKLTQDCLSGLATHPKTHSAIATIVRMFADEL